MAPRGRERTMADSMFLFTSICVFSLVFWYYVVPGLWSKTRTNGDTTNLGSNWGLAPNARSHENPKPLLAASKESYNLSTDSPLCMALLFALLLLVVYFSVAQRVIDMLKFKEFLVCRERDLKQRIHDYCEEIQEGKVARVPNRENVVELLQSLADGLPEHHGNENGAKIFGALGSVLGFCLAVFGFIVSYLTFEKSFWIAFPGALLCAFGIAELNYSERAKHEMKKSLFEDYALLEKAALEYVRKRKETIKTLKRLVDDLTTHHINAEADKISGGVAGLVGSFLSLGGLLAAPFTLGLSAALVFTGATVGLRGGITVAGAFVSEEVSSSSTRKFANTILERDNDAYNGFIKAVHRVNAKNSNLLMTDKQISDGVKKFFNIVESVKNFAKQGRAPQPAGSVVVIAGISLSVVSILLNLSIINSSTNYFRNKTIPRVAQDILDDIKKINCPSEEEMKIIISEMKSLQLKQLLEQKFV